MAAPIGLRISIIAALSFLLIRHTLVLGGYVTAGQPSEVTTPSIAGRSISTFIRSTQSLQPGMLLVVTQEHCDACRSAKQSLPKMGVAWHQVPVCTSLSNQVCFDGKGMTFPIPLLLICDQQGRIIFEHQGWPSSNQEYTQLQDQIQTIQRRYQRKPNAMHSQ